MCPKPDVQAKKKKKEKNFQYASLNSPLGMWSKQIAAPPPPRIGTPAPRHAPSTQRQPLGSVSCVSFYYSKRPQHPSILTAHSYILLLLASLLFPECTRHIPTLGPLSWLCPLHIRPLPGCCTHGPLPHLYCVFLSRLTFSQSTYHLLIQGMIHLFRFPYASGLSGCQLQEGRDFASLRHCRIP